jgi:hypothetical protein
VRIPVIVAALAVALTTASCATRSENTVSGAVVGGATGAAVGGPVGAVVGAGAGAVVGETVPGRGYRHHYRHYRHYHHHYHHYHH